ncbi:MAG: alanyl-tRNA editing protein [Ruminococcaceae bacterium]|nr:alanyl-tRNA editing protein [Oscillospiraceae bacterium]
MTEKLFYIDNFATEFTATVVDCVAEKDYFAIVLDKTLFYPEGGGQPCDKGVLTFDGAKAEVFFTKEKNDVIYHHSYTQIPAGTQVTGRIDFARRFDLMQQHTGEHMLSGTINSLFGYDNVGFHLTENDMSIDFDGPLTKEDIDKAVAQVNAAIVANQPVTADYPDTTNLEYRSKKPLEGAIRIVRAGSADVCACCGVHVSTTAQVQMVAVRDFMNYKGGTRIFFGCGGRVFSDYMNKNRDCYDISHMLSCKIGEISHRVADKMKECDNLKMQLSAVKNEIFSYWVDAVPQGENGFIQKDGLSSGEVQKLCAELNKKCPTACVVSQQEDGSGKICLISLHKDTNTLGRAICAALGGKGGGKPGIFQGTLAGCDNAVTVIEEILNDK